MTQSLWDEYLATAAEKYEYIQREEVYKFSLAEALADTRKALLQGEENWRDLVKAAVKHKFNNIINWRNLNKTIACLDAYPDAMREALLEMWSEDDRTPGDRIRAFDGRLSENMLDIRPTAAGSRLNIASYLMMGIDPKQYPPYLHSRFKSLYEHLNYPRPSVKDAGVWYEHALGFLDRMLEEAKKRGMDNPANRMEAQSILYHEIYKEPEPESSPTPRTEVETEENMHPLNTILYGPPGTGKTWSAVAHAVALVENRDEEEVSREKRSAVKNRFEEYRREKRIEMVTFHQNMTYEDFIEGIRPVLAKGASGDGAAWSERNGSGEIQYEMSRGVFRRIAERAEQDPEHRYALVIDEINRGNIARIFGELITLIESSKRIGEEDEARAKLPGSKTDFGVPSNLYILGTMNTADRSIALMDTALRRRFVFREMAPNPSHPGVSKNIDGVNCRKVLKAINTRIAALLDREHQIGHTYFLGIDSMDALADAFRDRIMPLLQEYFYDDWEKIRATLNGNGFVTSSNPPEELVDLDLVDRDRKIYDVLPRRNDGWMDPAAYRKIYAAETAPNDAGATEDE